MLLHRRSLGTKWSDRYKRVVDLWRWSIWEVVLYIHGLILTVSDYSNICLYNINNNMNYTEKQYRQYIKQHWLYLNYDVITVWSVICIFIGLLQTYITLITGCLQLVWIILVLYNYQVAGIQFHKELKKRKSCICVQLKSERQDCTWIILWNWALNCDMETKS